MIVPKSISNELVHLRMHLYSGVYVLYFAGNVTKSVSCCVYVQSHDICSALCTLMHVNYFWGYCGVGIL